MADKKYYWLSPHRIKIDGIWRNTGDDFPADKVTDEKLAQWLKDGDAGELPFKAKAGRPSNDMKLLQDKLKEANENIAELKKQVTAAADEKADVQTDLDKANENIAELKKQVTKLTKADKK